MKPPLLFLSCLACLLLGGSTCTQNQHISSSGEIYVPLYPGDIYYLSSCPNDAQSIQPPVTYAGCDLPECFDACPDAAKLNWKVTMGKSAHIDQVSLLFSGVNLTAVSVSGATVQSPTELLLTGSEAEISGLANAKNPGDIRVVPQVKALTSATPDDSVMIYISQEAPNADAKSIVVSEQTYHYRMQNCTIDPNLTDQISLSTTPVKRAVAVVDGRFQDGTSSVCKEDAIYAVESSAEINIPNLLPSTGPDCEPRFTVFFERNGLYTQYEGISPTSEKGDIFKVTREERKAPSVLVWIVTSDPTVKQELARKAYTEIFQVEMLMRENLAGIQMIAPNFGGTIPNVALNYIDDPAKVDKINKIAFWDFGQEFCEGVEELHQSNDPSIFVPEFISDSGDTTDVINVYYVEELITGKTCTDHNRRKNIIFVGNSSHPATLAHEFGHAFSLAHVQHVPGMSTNNIMWFRTGDRNQFTLAQSFRMNRYPLSVINQNRSASSTILAPPPNLNCPDTRTDEECPDLRLVVSQ